MNNDTNIHSSKIIHYFSGDTQNKINSMTKFMNGIKDYTITNNINKCQESFILSWEEIKKNYDAIYQQRQQFYTERHKFEKKREKLEKSLLQLNQE